MTTLHIITGTTASGKTAYALDFAERNNAEIISCDSTLVYRGMNIGTAKPTPAELARVRHRCIDLVEPNETYSISGYIRDAGNAIADITARGKNVVIAGGSGFYLKAFFAPVTDAIPVAPEIVERVRSLAAAGTVALQNALLPFAPERPDLIDWNNPRRLAKALERCLASNRPLAEIFSEFKNAKSPFADFLKKTVLLERPPAELEQRIEARTRAMIAGGLIDEVRALRDAGKLIAGTPAASAVGYRETLARLAGGTGIGDAETLIQEIALNTRQLAAKQRKWFRTQIPVDEIIAL